MADTFNRHQFPAGGWKFRQPQTNWVNPNAMVGFQASVDAIVKHRKQNPAITTKHQLSTDPVAVGDELETFTRARLGIPKAAPVFFSPQSSRLPSRVVAVAEHIKRAASGTAVVLDWLGSGADPVAQELAEKRAAVCVACPKNQPGAWFTQAPAEMIRSSVQAWQALKGSSFAFDTSQGDNLKSCDVCKCLMKLKVFVDAKHIIAKTKPDVMAEFPPNCWVKCESASATLQ